MGMNIEHKPGGRKRHAEFLRREEARWSRRNGPVVITHKVVEIKPVEAVHKA